MYSLESCTWQLPMELWLMFSMWEFVTVQRTSHLFVWNHDIWPSFWLELPLEKKVPWQILFHACTQWVTTIVPSHFCIVLYVCKYLCSGLKYLSKELFIQVPCYYIYNIHRAGFTKPLGTTWRYSIIRRRWSVLITPFKNVAMKTQLCM